MKNHLFFYDVLTVINGKIVLLMNFKYIFFIFILIDEKQFGNVCDKRDELSDRALSYWLMDSHLANVQDLLPHWEYREVCGKEDTAQS